MSFDLIFISPVRYQFIRFTYYIPYFVNEPKIKKGTVMYV